MQIAQARAPDGCRRKWTARNEHWPGRRGLAAVHVRGAPLFSSFVHTGFAIDSGSPDPAGMRLNRFLAAAGLGSRRGVEEIITGGA
jgi:hypothetical protein